MQTLSKLSRRGALLLLAGAAAPVLSRAAEAPTRALSTSTPTLSSQGATPVAAAPSPSSSSSIAPADTLTSLGTIDATKAYFIFFQRSIDAASAKVLRNDLVALSEAGVTDITLVINSQGGLLTPSLQLYSLIQSLPAKIKTHAQGFVGSAANLLMLASSNRTADGVTRFIFHPSQGPVIGTFNSHQLDDQLLVFREYEDMLAEVYKTRTKIPASEIDRFKHESVSYDAAKALEYGIIDKVQPLEIPNGKAKLVFID